MSKLCLVSPLFGWICTISYQTFLIYVYFQRQRLVWAYEQHRALMTMSTVPSVLQCGGLCDEAADAISTEMACSSFFVLDKFNLHVSWTHCPMGPLPQSTISWTSPKLSRPLHNRAFGFIAKSSTLKNTWNCGHCHKSSVLFIRSYQPLSLEIDIYKKCLIWYNTYSSKERTD